MKANAVMKLQVVTVPPDLQVEAAHALMLKLGVRHLPVVSSNKLAGILSDRDVLLAVGRRGDGSFAYPPIAVGQLMSLAPVSAGRDASVADIAKAMVDSKFDAVPIVAGGGELVGLVTSTDLIRLLTELPSEPRPAFDFEIKRSTELHARA